MPKNIMQLLSLTALTTLSLSVCGDTIYKCKNQQGNLLYQKSPCKENVQTISSWTAAAKVKPPADESEKKNKASSLLNRTKTDIIFWMVRLTEKHSPS